MELLQLAVIPYGVVLGGDGRAGGVAQQAAEGGQVPAVAQEAPGEGVAEGVGVDSAFHARPFADPGQHEPDPIGRECLSECRQEEGVGVASGRTDRYSARVFAVFSVK